MPWLGFGVFQMEPGDETEQSVKTALRAGYRSLDTASVYGNEASVGKAVQESGLHRADLFITTKVWNSDLGYESTLKAFDRSLKKLQMDYLDLYLIHWPVIDRYVEAWKAMEKLYADGVVRAIGLSNFLVHQIEDILEVCEVRPTVNQIEFHPLLRQKSLHDFCNENQIQMEAWAPLIQGEGLTHPTIVDLSRKYSKTPAHILIRWDLQHEVVTIPKSSTPSRIVDNLNVFDFEISAEDMARIDALDENRRIGPDPDNFDL
jgi:diketogulonate reductase-like aldo/keto reductase